jgi:hypothetical protein
MNTTVAYLTRRLETHRAEASQRRLQTFVPTPQIIAGQILGPITLDTYTTLTALGNPLVTGGTPTTRDLFAYLWIHHPAFGPAGHPSTDTARRELLRRLMLHLRGPAPIRARLAANLVPLLHQLSPRLGPIRRWLAQRLRRWLLPHYRHTTEDHLQAALDTIRENLAQALGDFPGSTPNADQTANPPPYALNAQLLNQLARDLHQPIAHLRAMPLAQLAQHLRELIAHHTPGQSEPLALLDPEENRLWRDLLSALNPPAESPKV